MTTSSKKQKVQYTLIKKKKLTLICYFPKQIKIYTSIVCTVQPFKTSVFRLHTTESFSHTLPKVGFLKIQLSVSFHEILFENWQHIYVCQDILIEFLPPPLPSICLRQF